MDCPLSLHCAWNSRELQAQCRVRVWEVPVGPSSDPSRASSRAGLRCLTEGIWWPGQLGPLRILEQQVLLPTSTEVSSGHVWMWESDYKESWVLKNRCFWTVVLEKTVESPLDCKEIQPVHPKGNQSWVFIGKTDAEAEAPKLWPPNAKNWLIWKDPDAGKDWRWEEKGMTEDEMVQWYHWLNGHEFG